MKITIDTKEDSHTDIKRVIGMLQNLVGESKVYSNQGNIFESGDSEVKVTETEVSDEKPAASGNVFGNIFGGTETEDTPEPQETQASATETQETTESVETKDDDPQILPYDL